MPIILLAISESVFEFFHASQIEHHHRMLNGKLAEILATAKVEQLEFIAECSKTVENYRREKSATEKKMREMETEINRLTELKKRFECDLEEMPEEDIQVDYDDNVMVQELSVSAANSELMVGSLVGHNELDSRLEICDEQQPNDEDLELAGACIEIMSESEHSEIAADEIGNQFDNADDDDSSSMTWFRIQEVCTLRNERAAPGNCETASHDDENIFLDVSDYGRSENVEWSDSNCYDRGQPEAGRFYCRFPRCNLEFSTKNDLKMHITEHTGEKIFQCKQCGEQFTDSRLLDGHMKAQIGETPGCGTISRANWRSHSHMEAHTNELHFQCYAPECGRKFKLKSSMVRHMKNFHPVDQTFECKNSECRKQFRTAMELSSHKRNSSRCGTSHSSQCVNPDA